MSRLHLTRRAALLATGAAALAGREASPKREAFAAEAAGRPAAGVPRLEQVAGFDGQVTGVAVAENGRTFVNFPRWEKDVPVSVAEVMPGGKLKPYPDARWNEWRNLHPLSTGDHWVCVQSVTIDPQGFLWVVDPAAPGNEFIKPGGPKLVKIDLATDKVVQVVLFDTRAAPQGSYMNDVRVSPDGRWAFLTDSGQKGALVVDVAAGTARRVLDGDPRTQPEPGVVPMTDGHELRRPDHRIPAFAADGIALDREGRWLCWQALVGRTLYRVPAAALTDPAADAGAQVERVATTHVADGLWIDRGGRLFITDPAANAVRMRLPDGTVRVAAQDPRLRWPDSMAEGSPKRLRRLRLGRLHLRHRVAHPGHGTVPRARQHAAGALGAVPDSGIAGIGTRGVDRNGSQGTSAMGGQSRDAYKVKPGIMWGRPGGRSGGVAAASSPNSEGWFADRLATWSTKSPIGAVPCRKRCSMVRTASGLLSTPTHRRPSMSAATRLVPAPAKQSSTKSPALLDAATMRRKRLMFFSVG